MARTRLLFKIGFVYHKAAFDPVIERQVALKTIRVDLAEADYGKLFMARFRNQAKAAGRHHHPNIVGIHGFGHSGFELGRQELIALRLGSHALGPAACAGKGSL